ncbi:nuclease-related domain-containing protein [Acetobacter conturbans]|uniref:NERD domain-containing protein n=1 Tax=Acetobacter conturbans TaxID=1737472 RepID=A0ABX0K1X3_9PROT|nr:nuclease-related domain-containing protein [Acetobacter conturbans]NHN89714.1 hypothetical protein [Acetobacter conturbans]
MPAFIAILVSIYVIYNYLNEIIELSLIVFIGFVAYKMLTGSSAKQSAPPPRQPSPSYTSYTPRPAPESAEEPLPDLRDDEPPEDAAVSTVADAFEDERPCAKGLEGETRVNRILKNIGRPYLSNVYLEDDKGLTQIDHLVKMNWGIVVIETKTYGGFISGTKNPSQWKQSFKKFGSGKYYLFQNPIRQNYRHVCAVQHISGLGGNIFPRVVLAGDARTSFFIHKQIIRLRRLQSELSQRPNDASYIPYEDLDAAWNRLKQQAKTNKGREQEHLASLQARSV